MKDIMLRIKCIMRGPFKAKKKRKKKKEILV